ncbi:MAG: type II toxin-antitoxin system HicB family antitoxin [Acidobacteriota bacterium]
MQNIPFTRSKAVKTYIFQASLEQEEDGRWSSWIESLPGCTAWGYTKHEALEALKDATELYLQDMLEAGEEVPKEGVNVVEDPVVAVTL